MANYTWPAAIVPSSAALTWMDNTREFVSPLSGQIRTEGLAGGRWKLSLTVQSLKSKTGPDDPLHLLEAFLFKLNGKEHRVICPDFGYSRAGSGVGFNPPTVVPSVAGAGQTGLSLNTDGWELSQTVMYAGDRIGVGTQMIPVTSDVVSDGTGAATINLAHPLRSAPADNAALELVAPTAYFYLNNQAGFDVKAGLFKTTMIELVEFIA